MLIFGYSDAKQTKLNFISVVKTLLSTKNVDSNDKPPFYIGLLML